MDIQNRLELEQGQYVCDELTGKCLNPGKRPVWVAPAGTYCVGCKKQCKFPDGTKFEKDDQVYVRSRMALLMKKGKK